MKRILILMLLLCSFIFANVAKITTFAGDVNIMREGNNLKASKDFQILKKDIIKTSKNGRAQLLFTDNTIISIGYNSTFSIDEYVNDSNKPPKVKLGLKKGFFKSITGKIGTLNPDRFKLKTKSASIGIRGTTILIQVGENNEKMICTQGGIRVENEKGWVDVDAGELTYVRKGQAPSRAEVATPDEIKELEKSSGASENEEESGVNQGSANAVKSSYTNQSSTTNNESPNITSNDVENSTIPLTDTGYELELEDNKNVSSNVYYKSSLTNYYNKSNDNFNSKQRLIVKSNTNNALSSVDGSYGDYLSWGHWGVTDDTSESKDDYSGSTYEGRSYWITGILTPASDVPLSGSATYTGSITGSVIRNTSSVAGSTLSGSLSITANFASNSMSGSFNVTGFANTTLSNVSITRETYGATFSGSLVGNGTTLNSGQIDGAFFGDNAKAIGGTWIIEDSSQNAAAGTFAGTK